MSRPLLTLLAAGLAIRWGLAFTTEGNAFDLGSFTVVRDALASDALHVYAAVDAPIPRWPYPPGFFPGIGLADQLAKATGLAYVDVLRALFSVGDLALAALAHAVLRRRDGDERRALLGAALVALGPSLFFISGNQGQLDGVAFVPAVLALLLWDDPRALARRALLCGVLLGLAAAVKTVPGILVLALLPTTRDLREAATLCAAAAGTLVALLVPFALATPHALADVLRYDGLPGLGGLSLLAQPKLPQTFLSGVAVPQNGLVDALEAVNGPLVLVALVAVGALLCSRKASPAAGAVALVLTVLVLGVNFAFGYAVWAVVVLVLDGRLRAALALQAALAIPMLFVALIRTQDDGWPPGAVNAVFVPLMLASFLGLAALWITVLREPA